MRIGGSFGVPSSLANPAKRLLLKHCAIVGIRRLNANRLAPIEKTHKPVEIKKNTIIISHFFLETSSVTVQSSLAKKRNN